MMMVIISVKEMIARQSSVFERSSLDGGFCLRFEGLRVCLRPGHKARWSWSARCGGTSGPLRRIHLVIVPAGQQGVAQWHMS